MGAGQGCDAGKFQTLKVVSRLPAKMVRPDREKAIQTIAPVWPWRVASSGTVHRIDGNGSCRKIDQTGFPITLPPAGVRNIPVSMAIVGRGKRKPIVSCLRSTTAAASSETRTSP